MNIIRRDIEAYAQEYDISGCSLIKWLQLMIHYRSFRTLWYYRMGKWTKIISWLLPGEPTFHIPNHCIIGEGTLFFHSYGTILNAKSIGKNCRITCNITLGDKAGKIPIIGNRVEILPGAVIAGGVIIGDDCVIGPNAVVYKSVPANCVVVGNPAYILKQNGIIVNKPL